MIFIMWEICPYAAKFAQFVFVLKMNRFIQIVIRAWMKQLGFCWVGGDLFINECAIWVKWVRRNFLPYRYTQVYAKFNVRSARFMSFLCWLFDYRLAFMRLGVTSSIEYEPSFSIAYSFSPCRKWFLVSKSIRPTRSVVEIPSVRLTSL